VSNLADAGEAIAAAGREFDAGLVYGSGYEGEPQALAEQARKLRELGAARVLLHDPTGSLQPHTADELVRRLQEESGLPVGLYCQGAGGNALAAALQAARAGADRIACAIYPVALALHRVSGEGLAESLAGIGIESGVDVLALWRASELVDQHIGDEPVTPLAPRIAVRAAEHRLPAGLVAALDMHLRAHAAGDRMDEVLEELGRIRAEAGWPPLAAPIGQILASQALVHVLSASRYQVVVDELRELLDGRYCCSRSSRRRPSRSCARSAAAGGARRRWSRAASTRRARSESGTSSGSSRSPASRRSRSRRRGCASRCDGRRSRSPPRLPHHRRRCRRARKRRPSSPGPRATG
jgi:pyruvate/oxaloacetate carboxyltransferase